jgi:hypothetical protein
MATRAMVYAQELYGAWGDFLYAVRTGNPGVDHMFGMNGFEYFEKNPEAGRIFNEAMVGYTNRSWPLWRTVTTSRRAAPSPTWAAVTAPC